MPRKATAPKLLPTSVRFTREMKDRLVSLADADNRSLSNFIETEMARIADQREAEAKAKRKP